MNEPKKVKLFLVDDDMVFLKSLEIDFLQNRDCIIKSFATGELCIANLSETPDVIILDYHLDGIDKNAINGIATLDKIKAFNADIPVVMLSSQDNIDIAISCMHHKAFDYVVKSETAFVRLQHIITYISDNKKIANQLEWYMKRM